VHPPEAVVNPVRMLALAGELAGRLGVANDAGSLPVHVAHRGPDGRVDEVDLAFGAADPPA
jgi:hypothetical protein